MSKEKQDNKPVYTVYPQMLVSVVMSLQEWEALFGAIAPFIHSPEYDIRVEYSPFTDYLELRLRATRDIKRQVRNAIENIAKVETRNNAED